MLKPLLALIAFLAAVAPASAALTPDQLTPAEKKVYDTLVANPANAQKYLITRDYLRKCDAVLANPATAGTLPVQPEGLFTKYLNAAERARIDEAVDLYIAMLLSGRSSFA